MEPTNVATLNPDRWLDAGAAGIIGITMIIIVGIMLAFFQRHTSQDRKLQSAERAADRLAIAKERAADRDADERGRHAEREALRAEREQHAAEVSAIVETHQRATTASVEALHSITLEVRDLKHALRAQGGGASANGGSR